MGASRSKTAASRPLYLNGELVSECSVGAGDTLRLEHVVEPRPLLFQSSAYYPDTPISIR
jgi:hypothetical protein